MRSRLEVLHERLECRPVRPAAPRGLRAREESSRLPGGGAVLEAQLHVSRLEETAQRRCREPLFRPREEGAERAPGTGENAGHAGGER